MEEQKNEVKKSRETFWWIFDVCLFGMFVLLFFVQWDPLGIVDYLTGYFGGHLFTCMDLWLIYCWPMYVFLLIAGIVRIRKWIDSFQKLCKLLPAISALLILMALSFPFVAISIPAPFPKMYTYIMGFHHWMNARIDLNETRTWINSLDEKTLEYKSLAVVRNKFITDANDVAFAPESFSRLYPPIAGGFVHMIKGQKCLDL